MFTEWSKIQDLNVNSFITNLGVPPNIGLFHSRDKYSHSNKKSNKSITGLTT